MRNPDHRATGDRPFSMSKLIRNYGLDTFVEVTNEENPPIKVDGKEILIDIKKMNPKLLYLVDYLDGRYAYVLKNDVLECYEVLPQGQLHVSKNK